jgi:RNA-binding protein YhbY
MPLTPRRRRELARSAHGLHVSVHVAGTPGESAMEQIRAALSRRELVKVRVQTDDRETCRQVGAQLADRVPCELVARVGRVLLLYRSAGERSTGEGSR